MQIDLKKLFRDTYAVIWDMDGVLVDSESYHFEAHKKMLASYGITLTKEYYIHHGVAVPVEDFYKEIFARDHKDYSEELFVKIHYQKMNEYQQLQREKGIKTIPHAERIVKKLYQNGVLMAIASQVLRDEVARNLRGTGLMQYFPIIIAGGDFGLPKKPAPDVYNKVIELLNIKKENIIAIEDSSIGAQSAVNAGITCLVVTNEFTKDHTFSKEAIVTQFSAIESAIS